MSNLILVRHGQSEWNLENRFTGWVDVQLSAQGKLEACKAGELIKQQKLKHQNKKRTQIINNKNDDDDQVKTVKSVFAYLPNECISHICGYLNKTNIRMFKQTSRQIAVVCLEEMKKISVGILNGNTFLNYNGDLNHLRANTMIKYSRYSSKKRSLNVFN